MAGFSSIIGKIGPRRNPQQVDGVAHRLLSTSLCLLSLPSIRQRHLDPHCSDLTFGAFRHFSGDESFVAFPGDPSEEKEIPKL